MPTMNESALADWRITYLPAGGSELGRTETVRAVYPCGQDDLPGWTLLKDHEHRIIKLVRDDLVQDIERTGRQA